MNPIDRLTLALIELAGTGPAPRCSQLATHHYWTSERPEQRALAAQWCTGCPVLDSCALAGAGEKFGVWAGVDRTGASVPSRYKSKPPIIPIDKEYPPHA